MIAAAPTLPATEAMAAGDSLWASFEAGRTSFAQVVTGMRALAKHPERHAATFIPTHLEGVASTLLSPEDARAAGRLQAALYAPRLAELGLDLHAGAYASEPVERRELRRQLIGIVAEAGLNPSLRGRIRSALDAYLAGDQAALDPAFRPIAYDIAAQDGGDSMLTRLFDRLIQSNDPQERSAIVGAIGHVDHADRAPRVIALSRDPRLRNLEGLRMVLGLLRNASTRDQGYTYIVSNFGPLVKSTPLIASNLLGIGSGYCSEQRARQTEVDLRPKVAQYHLSALELDRSVEAVRQCAAFKAAKGAEIRAGLAAFR